jgi:membrane protein DedA with SNARE-associated domain
MDVEPATTSATELRPDAPGDKPGVEITVTRADVLCVGPIAVLMIYQFVMTFIAPSMVGPHPVLLAAIRGSSSAMLAAGAAARTGSVALWVVCVAPIAILMAADPFLYWAGRRYGRRLVDYLAEQDPRWRKRMVRSERWFQRWGAWSIAFGYYIPFVPATLFYLAAGESRMRIRTFVIADLAGTLTWIGIHIGAGYAAGKRARDIAQTISRYGLWIAVVMIVAVVGWTVYTQMNRREPVAAR